MKYLTVQVTFQEVPDEISLCFLITGCPLKCPGCHSPESWNAKAGTELNRAHLEALVQSYHPAITCVCFLGGEWHEDALIELCWWSHQQGLKTCLYTGLEDVSPKLRENLDYLKVGPYIRERSGLSSTLTNQRFINLKTNEILNHQFHAQGGRHDENDRSTKGK